MALNLEQEIRRFDPVIGAESATTPPATWYTRPEFHELDRHALLNRWQPVGHVSFLDGANNFFSGDFAGEPYVVVRDEKGELRAFYNVCRHHATCIMGEKGHAKEMVCPYHGWTYGLDGGLKRAPHMGAQKNFSREKMGLRPIPIKTWGPLIFLCFSATPPPFPPEWEPLLAKLQATGLGNLQFAARKSYEIRCNWKVYVDNYLDGGYHVGQLHKGLAGQLDLDAYRIENFSTYTIQSCKGADESKAPVAGDTRERIGDEAIYAWMHPNFMINRYGSMMDTNWVIPLSHDRTLTVFDYYFMDTSEAAQPFITSSLTASDVVQQEDIAICEAVQKGLGSVAYDVGRYSSKLETGAYLFHQLLHADLERARLALS